MAGSGNETSRSIVIIPFPQKGQTSQVRFFNVGNRAFRRSVCSSPSTAWPGSTIGNTRLARVENSRDRQDRRDVDILVCVYAKDHPVAVAVERWSRLSGVLQNR